MMLSVERATGRVPNGPACAEFDSLRQTGAEIVFNGVTWRGMTGAPYDYSAPFHGARWKWLPVVRDCPPGAVKRS